METKVQYISLKACPVCGEHPELAKKSLAKPGGGGYPGYFTYEYKCEFCGLLKSGQAHDLYISPDEAKNFAKELWNGEVDRIQKLQKANASRRANCN